MSTWVPLNPREMRISTWDDILIPADAPVLLLTALCSMKGTPRGEYDEEVDVIVHRRGYSLTRTIRFVQKHLEEQYEPGLRVRKMVRR